MSRLLIASNRLPLTVVADGGAVSLVPSPGGLATGLRGPHEQGDGCWFGWPGPLSGVRAAQRRELAAQLQAQRYVPIELRADEVAGYYNEISNGVLWPVFHYLVDRLPLTTPGWDVYRRVNERFAAAIAAQWRPGDVVWVHDFHLMLLPALLRERLPAARIGFFLHVPFPSSEVFRVLPWRRELLLGLVGADLIGFHTLAYLRHFAASLLRVLGLEVEVDRVAVGDRDVRLTALPMGIDTARFAQLGESADVVAEAAALRERLGATRLVVGIDRLDYTKGIPRRLLAFERFLEQRAPTAPPVQLVLVAATSRHDVAEYKAFKRSVDELVGRINGRFGTSGFTPVRYTNRGLDDRGVTALYRAADVMLVTPLRDGLNLVAKEFCAARTDGDGVLVLSEFAGVAAELAEAMHFNPYDVDEAAAVLARALAMPEAERRRRMASLREAVGGHDVHTWVQAFLDELRAAAPPAPPRPSDAAAAAAELAAARAAGRLCILLDHDGTLVDFGPRPEAVVPDAALRELLQRLAALPDVDVHIVSGRPRSYLERHFGGLGLSLHAEHGFASLPVGSTVWSTVAAGAGDWRDRAAALLTRVARHVPGSHVELKEQSIGWHFRAVDPAFAAVVVKELRLHLLELLSNVAASVVEGNRVLEIRPQGIHKGLIVAQVLAAAPPPARLVIVGDDRTDEDMFAVAPADAVTVQVGSRRSAARYRVADPGAARALLQTLLVSRASS